MSNWENKSDVDTENFEVHEEALIQLLFEKGYKREQKNNSELVIP